MKKQTRLLLEQCDELDAYEFPSKFDEKDIEKRARLVFSEISKVGHQIEFEGWMHNQDASFGLAIILIEFEIEDMAAMCQPVVRFSNFGNLVSITFRDLIPKEFFETIVKSIENNGFYYVDSDEIDCEYDGVMKGTPEIPTWWARYFDWL